MTSPILLFLSIFSLVISCTTGYFTVRDAKRGIFFGGWNVALQASFLFASIVLVACMANICYLSNR